MLNRRFLLLTLVLLLVLPFAIIGCGGDDDDDEEEDEIEDPFVQDDDDDTDDSDTIPAVTNEPPPWPEWVLRHWVWEDESTQDSALGLVQGYMDNDIPVGAIIIDSPWETGYNTFEWDENKFPVAQDMIDDFHENDVRVFLWITPNVNTDSPNFQEGLDAGYYVDNGKTYEWWKGDGAFIDYNNPDALAWWHQQMDKVLDMGIDGWKTDGSAFTLWLSGASVQTFTGPINPHEYQALYYSDFFNYSRQKLGNDRVITARPVDSYGVPFWGPIFAPQEVNFAGWVGDQDPDWRGLTNALVNMFLSADKNFVNFGSDIGGYRGDEMRQKELLIRWAQLGALCPIMENGGAGEHRPWVYDDETLEIYRDYVNLHHALLPYLYSQGAVSYETGVSLMRPYFKKFQYMLGDSFFVHAINSEENTRTITFPAGTWIDWFTGQPYEGLTTQEIEFSIDRYPLFVKKGALIPMDLGDNSVFKPTDETLSPLTVQYFPEEDQQSQFDIYEEKGTGARFSTYTGNGRISVRLSSTPRRYALCVNGIDLPKSVTDRNGTTFAKYDDLDALKDQTSGWVYDSETGKLWVKPGDPEKGWYIYVNLAETE